MFLRPAFALLVAIAFQSSSLAQQIEADLLRYQEARAALELGQAEVFQREQRAFAVRKNEPHALCLADILEGFWYMGTQDYTKAIGLLTQAVADAPRTFGRNSRPHLDALTFLSWCQGYVGDLDEELRINQELLDHYLTDPVEYWMDIADTRNTVAMNFGLRGDRATESRIVQEGLDLLNSHKPDNRGNTTRYATLRWTLLNTYALSALQAGQFANARLAAEECRRILGALDPSSTQQAISEQIIGRSWWMLDRNMDSSSHYMRSALDRLAQNSRPDQPGIGSAPWLSYSAFYADILLQGGRTMEALEVTRRAEPYIKDEHLNKPGTREASVKLLLTGSLALLANDQPEHAQAKANNARVRLAYARSSRDLLELKWAMVQLAIDEARGSTVHGAALIDSILTHNPTLRACMTDEQDALFGTEVVDALIHFGEWHLRHGTKRNDGSKDRSLELVSRAFDIHIARQGELMAGGPDDHWAFGHRDPVEALLDVLYKHQARTGLSHGMQAAMTLMKAKGLLLDQQRWMERVYASHLTKEQEKERLRLRAKVFSASSTYMNSREREDASALITARATYSRFLNKLATQHPVLARRNAPVPDRDPRSAAVAHDAMLLDYYLGQQHMYIVHTSRDDIRFVQRSGVDVLRAHIARYRETALHPGRWSDGTATTATGLTDLEAIRGMVLDPLKSEGPLTEELIIIPHDALYLINFEMLPASDRKDHYLIQDHLIRYVHGTSSLHRQEAPPPIRKNTSLGVFSASRFGALPLDDSYAQAIARSGLFDLAGVVHEAEKITTLFKGVHVAHATASDFLAKASAFNVLHIGTHGFSHPDGQGNSFLLFEGTNSWEDRITGAQVAGMQLDAELVVLSACNTGLGALLGPEGTASLSRAFFQAGSRSVVSGLWQIPDARTSDIMISFYSHLKDGLGRAEALRQAKLDHIHSHSGLDREPYYWAGLVLYGEEGALAQGRQSRWWWLIALAALSLVYFALCWSRRHNASAR